MNLILYVHDCFSEIGHGKALVETVNNFPKEKIKSIKVVAFTSDKMENLFPDHRGNLKFVKVPLPNLKPFIFKVIFYHIWTILYRCFNNSKENVHIGIGIASLWVDIVNVQFVHQQWEKFIFKIERMSLIKSFYKKILFLYFRICENLLYRQPDIKIGCLSQFVKDWIQTKYNIPEENIKTIYSGVDLEKFDLDQRNRDELFNYLLGNYPQLKNIDISKPIALFIGAFERKGLQITLEKVSDSGTTDQAIVIGKGSVGSKITFPNNVKVSIIEHTKELHLFYSLCDAFIFPTVYEPFGLVIIEAVAMGLEVFTTSNQVGASEIIKNLPKVNIFEHPSQVNLSNLTIISIEEKSELIEKRLPVLKEYSWKNAGDKYWNLVESYWGSRT